MRYMIALCCPPLAIALARRPLQAIASTLLLVAAVATWSHAIGVVLAALVMLWACRAVGEHEAELELAGFRQLFNSTRPQRR
jgi:hypothetical protein